jgi:hypothetical protein
MRIQRARAWVNAHLRLWDHLDSLRDQWLRDGSLPVYGAAVVITPDGSITFQRGKWTATIPASPPAGLP